MTYTLEFKEAMLDVDAMSYGHAYVIAEQLADAYGWTLISVC